MAQDEATPKVELFVGYQWLHPGITVPAPFQPAECSDRSKRWAIFRKVRVPALTYNFTRIWGLEADYGGNKNKNGTVNTVSIGPRFAWRNEGITFFAPHLAGLQPVDGAAMVDTSNGIGAILGGGMDLDLWRRLSLRLFEADWVWANHNFSDEVGPAFPDLRRPR